jgi:hypothetical protein
MSNNWTIVNYAWKRVSKEAGMGRCNYSPYISLKKLKNTTIIIGEDSQSPGRDQNRGPSEALALESTSSVDTMYSG